jgi:hypothetical protein
MSDCWTARLDICDGRDYRCGMEMDTSGFRARRLQLRVSYHVLSRTDTLRLFTQPSRARPPPPRVRSSAAYVVLLALSWLTSVSSIWALYPVSFARPCCCWLALVWTSYFLRVVRCIYAPYLSYPPCSLGLRAPL